MKKLSLMLVLALIICLPLSASAARVKVGMPHAPFEVKNDAGKMVKSEDIIGKGKVVVLNFMNTVCSTCATELEFLTRLQQENDKVAVYPVAVDMRGESTIVPFKETHGYTFSFLLDPRFKVGRQYGATYTPYTVIIGTDGVVKAVIGGYDDETGGKIKDAIK